MRLFNEVRAAGYPDGYGQVDFADFRLPWGKRHAQIVVLGYSRRMWLKFYERQTMPVVMRGLEASFACFGGVPSELLFDQMKAVISGAILFFQLVNRRYEHASTVVT